MAKQLRFYLNIGREEALRYYQGTARFVIATSTDGQRLQFPAEQLRPFIDQKGISGQFSIEFDDNNKLIGLKRV
jgi:hypothetical protein